LKALKKDLNTLLEEKNSLMKIKGEQMKALDYLRNEEEYSTKVLLNFFFLLCLLFMKKL